MNFIFDVLLNFNKEELCSFYEWNSDDNIKYIKQIPFYRIDDKCFIDIKNNDIQLDKAFLNKIYKNSEAINDNSIKCIKYACVFTNLKDAFAIEFDSDGRTLLWGCLLMDELYEVLDKSQQVKPTNINYKIIRQRKNMKYLTRKQRKIVRFLNKEIDLIYDDKNLDKLRYLYYECLGTFNNNLGCIYQRLKQFINKDWTNNHIILYELISLSNQKEVMSKNP
jgi:hypothetical protein